MSQQINKYMSETAYTSHEQENRFAGDYRSMKLNTELDKHKANHGHEENMAKLGIEKELKEAELANELELKKYTYKTQLGWLGRVFGGVEVASKYITAIICVFVLIGMITLSIIAYDCNDGISKIKDIWSIGTPILTLSLGYLFGKN